MNADDWLTIGLFVLTVPLVAWAVITGLFMTMLGDGRPRSPLSRLAVHVAVAGPGLGAIAIDAGAMYLAAHTPGRTFHIPLIATGIGAVWVILVVTIAGWVVDTFR